MQSQFHRRGDPRISMFRPAAERLQARLVQLIAAAAPYQLGYWVWIPATGLIEIYCKDHIEHAVAQHRAAASESDQGLAYSEIYHGFETDFHQNCQTCGAPIWTALTYPAAGMVLDSFIAQLQTIDRLDELPPEDARILSEALRIACAWDADPLLDSLAGVLEVAISLPGGSW